MKKFFTFLSFLTLSSAVQAQTIASAAMETWSNYTVTTVPMVKPTGWASSDSIVCPIVFLSTLPPAYSPRVTKSTSVFHGGTASAKLESPSTDTFPTLITNAAIKVDLTTFKYSYSGGTPVSKRIAFVKAWTQYSHTAAIDTGRMLVYATKVGIAAGGKDSVIGQGEADINSSASFVQKNVYIKYVDASTIPDRIIVAFQPSKLTVRPGGTILYVDDVTISDPTGIETPLINVENIKVYPNPVLNQLNINTEMKQSLTVQMFNNIGQLVLSHNFNQNTNVNVSGLTTGIYTYVISGADGQKYYAGTLSKQ